MSPEITKDRQAGDRSGRPGRGRISFVPRKRPSQSSSAFRSGDDGLTDGLRRVNRVLGPVVAVSLVIFVAGAGWSWFAPDRQAAWDMSTEPPPVPASDVWTSPSRPALTDLSAALAENNLFRYPQMVTEPVDTGLRAQPVTIQRASLEERTRALNLVGIVIDGEPKAIIENRQSRETLFLSPGDRIGDIFVRDIRYGEVILEDATGQAVLTP